MNKFSNEDYNLSWGMGDSHLGAVKVVLEQDRKDISDMVARLQDAKRDLPAWLSHKFGRELFGFDVNKKE